MVVNEQEEQNDPSEQDLFFSTEEYVEERESMINSKHTTQKLQVLNPAQAFGMSSHGRQHTMSHTMQDSIDQGLLHNFAEAMSVSIDSSTLVFLGNNYNARHDYELEV